MNNKSGIRVSVLVMLALFLSVFTMFTIWYNHISIQKTNNLTNTNGENKMGLSWNSWYNPLDNVANFVRDTGSALVGGAKGAAYNTGNGKLSTGNRIIDGVNREVSKNNTRAKQPASTGGGGGAATQTYYQPSQTSYSDQGGGSTSTADAYAAQQAAERANMLEGFMNQKGSILDSVGGALNTAGNRLGSGIDQFLQSYKTSQRGINEGGINAALAKQQGIQGILGSVGRNIKSGNVMLSNKNASDSSAAGALAQAYGEAGRRQAAGVGNQFEQKQNELGMQQADLADQAALYQKEVGREKENVVNSIVDSTRQQLSSLNEAMIGASLPDRIEISKEIDAIKQRALSELSAYDKTLKSGMSKYRAIDRNEMNRQAAARATQGYDLGDNMFDYENVDQGQFNDTGAQPADFPLYTFNRDDNEQQV